MKTFINLIYYLGLVTCGIQGSEISYNNCRSLCIPSSFLAALGGGLLRDIFILRKFPVAFTKDCIPDITIALCSGVFFRVITQKKLNNYFTKQYVNIMDALGLGSFIAIGVNQSLFLHSTLIAVICGVVTALGGGIISSLFCGQSLRKILISNWFYKITTILGSIIYIFFLNKGIQQNVAQIWLIIFTFCSISMLNSEFKVKLIKQLVYISNRLIVMPIAMPKVIILYRINNHTSFSCYFFIVPKKKVQCLIRYISNLPNGKLLYPRRFICSM